jgi:hypothetical protein
MHAKFRKGAPYFLGLALVGAAIADFFPKPLAAIFAVGGVVLMLLYAFRSIRGGELGHRSDGAPLLPPPDGTGTWTDAGGHHHHGGHGGDFGGFGGGHGGGHGGH